MSKVIASLLSNMSAHLFLDNKNPVAIANNIEDIFLKYVGYDINENFHPDEVKCFFDNSCLFIKLPPAKAGGVDTRLKVALRLKPAKCLSLKDS